MAKAKAKPAAKAKTKPTAKAKPSAKPAAKPTAKMKPRASTPPASKPTANASPASVRPTFNPPPPRPAPKPPAGGDRQTTFLADIIANPDDKKARLVYADLLQDAGDPRGEFIVLACARAETPDDDPRAAEQDAQIAALLKKHKKAWTAACGENKGARYEYRRGFVEKISLDAEDLLENADRIFGAEPIEELNVWKIDQSSTKLGGSRLAPILELPLHRIRRLSLARCQLTEADFAALAAATTLESVELLDLTNGGSAHVPIAPLGKATSLPKLRELILRGCMIGDEGLEALAASKTLNMQKLILARNDLTAEAGMLIANAAWAPGLVHLDVSSNENFGDAGLAALAGSKKLGALRTLILEFTGLYQDAPELLRTAPLFKQLEKIDISATGVGADEVRDVLGDRIVQSKHGF